MGTINRFRRRQRGAAMAEFVLLMPVVIAMWMGIDYFRSGYARRLDALGQSQTAAWQRAYSNDMSCFKGGGGNFGGIAGLGANLGAGGGQQAQNAIDSFSSNSKTSSMFLYAEASASKSESTRLAGWDNSRGTVGGSTLVLCNEVVPGPKDDQDIITPLKSFITGVFPKF